MKIYKVLIVEDDDMLAKSFDVVLREHKNSIAFETQRVSSIRESEEILQHYSFDVILLDLTLPNGKGEFTFSRVYLAANKNIGKSGEDRTPIVVITGYDKDSYSSIILKGARDFITKPVSGSELCQRLHQAILLFPYTRTEELHDSMEEAIKRVEDKITSAKPPIE